MSIFLADSVTVDPAIVSTLLQYGILGIISLVLGILAWQQYKRLLERNDTLEDKVDLMQEKMNKIHIDDRNVMSKLVEENTSAIESLRNIIMDTLVALRTKPQ
jgi:hypothetical protein